jgi:hypothetical protein
VLAVVGEVQAEQLGVAAWRTELGPRREPHQVTAEGHRHVPQHRILAQRGVMGADAHSIVGPVCDRDDGQPGGVLDNEFDVVGVGSAATLIDDDDGFTELAHPNLQMAVCRRTLAGARDADLDGRIAHHILGDRDDGGAVERRERLSGNPIGWHTGLPEALVASAHRLHGDTAAFGDLDTGSSVGLPISPS